MAGISISTRAEVPTSDWVSFPGIGVSFGWRGPVTGRLSFEGGAPGGGGRILALPSPTRRDGDALRSCEALVTTEGDYLSYHAVMARELGLPVLVLEQASWARDKDGPYLLLEEPLYAGSWVKSGGTRYQAVSSTRQRRLREGEAVTIDAWAQTLTVYAPREASSRLAAAEALRAYDGLKDVSSLIRWFEDSSLSASDPSESGRLAAVLIEGAADRLMAGTAASGDFCRLRKGLLPLIRGSPKLLREREALFWTRISAEAGSVFSVSSGKIENSRTRQATERWAERVKKRWVRLKEMGECLERKKEISQLSVLVRETDRKARRRAEELGESGSGLSEAAASAGADLPARVRLDPGFYRRFIEDNSLSPKISRLSEDSSRDLRGKSAAIRALIRETPLSPESALGGDIASVLPSTWTRFSFVNGSDVREADRSRWTEALKEHWAESWIPAAILERRRAKTAVAREMSESFAQETVLVDVSGVAYSRSAPGAGGPRTGARLIVLASRGAADSTSVSDRYVLDPAGKELLPARLAGSTRVLPPEKLEAVARLLAALEDHYSTGLEIRFGYRSDRLFVLQAGKMAAAGE